MIQLYTLQVTLCCSAGVGRTGAIIALDYLLAQANAESRVDVYKCVEKMRRRRPFMIQTQVSVSVGKGKWTGVSGER